MIIKIVIWNIAYIFISNYIKFSFEMHENLFSINYDFSVIPASFLNRDLKKEYTWETQSNPKIVTSVSNKVLNQVTIKYP